ncbi:TPA: hypothetical protein PXO92_003833 [Yersinia enterocolitica]|nr:hypothetical protein [Yersinia enterocolitica]
MVVIETPFVNGDIREEFEMEDGSTEEEIAAEAKDIFMNHCDYGCHEITGIEGNADAE